MSEERCVVCGEIIPEGRQICFACEVASANKKASKRRKSKADKFREMMHGERGDHFEPIAGKFD